MANVELSGDELKALTKHCTDLAENASTERVQRAVIWFMVGLFFGWTIGPKIFTWPFSPAADHATADPPKRKAIGDAYRHEHPTETASRLPESPGPVNLPPSPGPVGTPPPSPGPSETPPPSPGPTVVPPLNSADVPPNNPPTNPPMNPPSNPR